ncbi:MAG: GNAT family N-acetyltransferase, partial [Gemmatimonadota bacterium]
MIRPLRPEDVETIAAIGDRAWKPIYAMFRQVYGEDIYRLAVPDPERSKGDQVRSHCQRAPEWVFVAEEEGRIVGFATCRLDRDSRIGEIGNNAVDPECGLKGIGQQLYAAVLAYFRE